MQFKFAAGYVVLIIFLLIIMNTYPVSMSRDLAFSAKKNSMQNQANIIASSLSELGTLNGEDVPKIMGMMKDLNLTRIIITDSEAKILYDTAGTEESLGKYALFAEITHALDNKDVFYSEFKDRAFMSREAVPIRYSGDTIGAVYLYDYDTDQATLIYDIQNNMMKVSYVVFAFSLILAIVFSWVLTKQISRLLSAIRTVREGNYDYVIDVQGKDELAQLGRELNIMAERLKATDEMRRRFVSDASHELKTPLAAIKLLSDSIVQNEMDAGTIRDFVNDIGKEADRLVKITEDLLSISKLEGRKASVPYIVDMKDVVTNALQMLRLLAENSGVSISYELDEGCFVLATEDDLHQIVFNIIENAIKYNNIGGNVRVRLAKTGKFVLFIAEDTGVGIPDEDIPFIFDRFYRVDKARSREAGGSGLGLSIVREAVTRYGGSVEAAAREEGGSRFIVRFPVCGKGGSVK